jgi:hypothetical protein
MKNLVFRIGDTLQVIRKGTTSNDKIESNKKRNIVQTYTFSKKQFELIAEGKNEGMKHFFSSADSNCLDCPYNSFGKCYTHKFNQYVGFVSMLKSIAKQYQTFQSIPKFSEDMVQIAYDMCKGTYVRFGTYGEPSVHPEFLISAMSSASDSWTGYTHQWSKTNLGSYFMASTHSIEEQMTASKMGYRSFMAVNEKVAGVVNCPASKEAGYKSTCSKCNLCSGTIGTKATKSVYILNH